MAEQLERKDQNLHRAAVVLSMLGTDKAIEVARRLDPLSAHRLIRSLNDLGDAASGGDGQAERLEVLRDLLARLERGESADSLAAKLRESVLNVGHQSTMSGKDAEVFFERLALLDKADASFIWRALAGETPQAIALIANHLSPANVAKLLAVMPSEVREEVSFRMLVQGPPRPEALTALAQGSEHFLKIAATGGEIKESQTQFFVDVVSAMGRTLGRDVLVALRERNEELADAIEQKMFTFQDLLKLPGVHLQAVLRNVAIADLALAMKGTSATQREGILSNLSQRARAVLEEEISLLGAVVLQDVERAQREIVQAARTLEASGEIQLEASNVEYIE